jgi:hypothetical protein
VGGPGVGSATTGLGVVGVAASATGPRCDRRSDLYRLEEPSPLHQLTGSSSRSVMGERDFRQCGGRLPTLWSRLWPGSQRCPEPRHGAARSMQSLRTTEKCWCSTRLKIAVHESRCLCGSIGESDFPHVTGDGKMSVGYRWTATRLARWCRNSRSAAIAWRCRHSRPSGCPMSLNLSHCQWI